VQKAPAGYTIEPARADDIAALPAIEVEASTLFSGSEVESAVLADSTTIEDFAAAQSAGLLWVARHSDGETVGFAFLELVDGQPHLDEIDVLPSHGRRGVGRALVETVCAWAQQAGHSCVTLTTYLDIPWNAPFYRRLGFRPLQRFELTPGLDSLVQAEAARGLDPSQRCVMRRDLTTPVKP
jgi:GNAT superfamily N-acetyltransferase